MQRTGTRTDGALLGRGGGLLLIALGLVALSLLFHATVGHRARLAAEVLGVLFGGGVTLGVVGVRRPSAQLVTRAYACLSAYLRALFIAGLALLFGFGLLTASIASAMPSLRQIPAFGGLVTLDWLVSLTMLGTAGSMLLFLGFLAFRSQRVPRERTTATGIDDAILERLWLASNSDRVEALRRCFGARDEAERLCATWCRVVGPPGASQVLLVSSSTVWNKVLSEWHVRDAGDLGSSNVRRLVLLARIEAGVIVSGDLYQVIKPTEGSADHFADHPRQQGEAVPGGSSL